MAKLGVIAIVPLLACMSVVAVDMYYAQLELPDGEVLIGCEAELWIYSDTSEIYVVENCLKDKDLKSIVVVPTEKGLLNSVAVSQIPKYKLDTASAVDYTRLRDSTPMLRIKVKEMKQSAN